MLTKSNFCFVNEKPRAVECCCSLQISAENVIAFPMVLFKRQLTKFVGPGWENQKKNQQFVFERLFLEKIERFLMFIF